MCAFTAEEGGRRRRSRCLLRVCGMRAVCLRRRRGGIESGTGFRISWERPGKTAGAVGGEESQKPPQLGKISCVAGTDMV